MICTSFKLVYKIDMHGVHLTRSEVSSCVTILRRRVMSNGSLMVSSEARVIYKSDQRSSVTKMFVPLCKTAISYTICIF